MPKLLRTSALVALLLLVLGVTARAAFTALCGSGTACAYVAGDRFGYQTVEQIRQNFNALVAAKYVTTEASSDLTNEVSLGALTTGLLKHTVSGSVSTPATAVAGTDYIAPSGADCLAFGSGGVLLCTKTQTITDAQVKALPTTAITVVAAPGAGRVVTPIRYLLITDFSAAAYTNLSDGGYIYIGYDGIESSGRNTSAYIADSAADSLTKLTGLMAAADSVYALEPYQETLEGWGLIGYGGTQANLVNKPLQMRASNSGNYTGGNAANVLKVITHYLDAPI
jgi:hypothetical protein